MADKLKAVGVLNSLVNKLKDENENLKKKNERLIQANKDWTKQETKRKFNLDEDENEENLKLPKKKKKSNPKKSVSP